VEFGRKWADRGVAVMFVSMDFPEGREDAAKFLAKQGVPGRGYVRTGKDLAFIDGIDPKWGGTLPTTLVFDVNRNVVELYEGEMSPGDLETAVRRGLAGAGSSE